MPDHFKTVATFLQLHEARLSQVLLNAAGIDARLADSGIVGAHPLLSNAVGGVKLQVLAVREADAKRILEDARKASPVSDSACMSCGAHMAEHESRCASCGWSYLDEGESGGLKH